MKKSCTNCCFTCPVLGLWLMRVVVAVIFLLPGMDHLMNLEAFKTGLLGPATGLEGTLLTVVAVATGVIEVLGAIALLGQKWIPKCIGKLLILALIPVVGGMIMSVALPKLTAGEDPMAMINLLFHVLLAVSAYTLASVGPKCPFGISGCKTVESSCSTKK